MEYSEAGGKLIHEKNQKKILWNTVPLSQSTINWAMLHPT